MTDRLIEQLGRLGVGLYKRRGASESRLGPDETWRFYRERVIVWARRDDFDDHDVQQLIQLLQDAHEIETLRFSGTAVTARGAELAHQAWPNARLEGV